MFTSLASCLAHSCKGLVRIQPGLAAETVWKVTDYLSDSYTRRDADHIDHFWDEINNFTPAHEASQ